MYIAKSGAVTGSIDINELTDHAAKLGIKTKGLTQDELVTAVNNYAATEGVDDSVTGDDSDDADGVGADDGAEDLSKLYKAELVERAAAAGIETDGLSKAELVEALEAQESEGT